MSVKVDATVFKKRMSQLSELPSVLLKDALKFTKENTPVASGNARNKTTIKGNKVVSDYAYAGRLNDGYSKQAPSGFTQPTIQQLDDAASKYVRKI